MKTLMEYKNETIIWKDIIHKWLDKNTDQKQDPIVFNRPMNISDFEGIAAQIAYAIYTEYNEPQLNDIQKLFLKFLSDKGITAQFLTYLKEDRLTSFKSIEAFLAKTDYTNYVRIAFEWRLTKEGYTFWSKIALDWYHEHSANIPRL